MLVVGGDEDLRVTAPVELTLRVGDLLPPRG